jgi:hypothetical protein
VEYTDTVVKQEAFLVVQLKTTGILKLEMVIYFA